MPRSILLAAIAFLALPACLAQQADDTAEDTQDAAFALEASDSAETVEGEAALIVASVDAAIASMTAEEAAQAAAGAAAARFQPAGCAETEVEGTTVTYTLSGCSGPFGIARIDGTVQVSFSVAADGLHATLTGEGVSAHGATLDLDAEAVYVAEGTTKIVDVTTASSAVGPRGRALQREGSYSVRWDAAEACASLDGSWSTRSSARTWSTEVTGLERCAGQCPGAGGVIGYTGGVSGVTITIQLDGSDAAAWTSSRGPSGSIDLQCGG